VLTQLDFLILLSFEIKAPSICVPETLLSNDAPYIQKITYSLGSPNCTWEESFKCCENWRVRVAGILTQWFGVDYIQVYYSVFSSHIPNLGGIKYDA